MIHRLQRLAHCSWLLLAAFIAYADPPEANSAQTGWLEPRAGFTDKQSGVRIDEVEDVDPELLRIEISLPDLERPIEEVEVVGKREKFVEKIKQKKQFEMINDPDAGRYGIIIYLGKRQNFALKINYREASDNFPDNDF